MAASKVVCFYNMENISQTPSVYKIQWRLRAFEKIFVYQEDVIQTVFEEFCIDKFYKISSITNA